jgi:hypothetical protein
MGMPGKKSDNEAFAYEAVAVIRTLRLDPGRVNVNGGALALDRHQISSIPI